MVPEIDIVRNQGASPSGRFEAQHRLLERKNRRARLKAGLFLALALFAGVAIGAGGALLIVKSRMRPRMPRAEPEQIGRSILERLGETVELTVGEKSRLEEIVLSHMVEVDKARTEFLQDIGHEFDNMNDQVDEILGSERSEKWEADKRNRYGKHYRGKEDRHRVMSRRGNPSAPPLPGSEEGGSASPKR